MCQYVCDPLQGEHLGFRNVRNWDGHCMCVQEDGEGTKGARKTTERLEKRGIDLGIRGGDERSACE